jgi:hypothetical protein
MHCLLLLSIVTLYMYIHTYPTNSHYTTVINLIATQKKRLFLEIISIQHPTLATLYPYTVLLNELMYQF